MAGIATARPGHAAWCETTVRMVAPRLWLGRALASRVPMDRLRAIAEVVDAGEGIRVDLRNTADLRGLEAALEDVLPHHAPLE